MLKRERDEQCCKIFRCGKSQNLAQVMLGIAPLPEEKHRGIEKARQKYVEGSFNFDRVVDMWEALYKELLEQKGRRQ